MNQGAFYGVVFSVLWDGYSFLRVFCLTIKRDLTGLYRYLTVLLGVRSYQRRNCSVPMVFEEHVQKHPNKVAFIFEDKKWTFKMVSEFSNKVAHVFEDAGFKPGDTIAVVLENRPEYIGFWIGLAKAGLVSALINHNLRGSALHHSIQIAKSKAVIFGADFTQAIADVRDQLGSSVQLFAFDVGQNPPPVWAENLDSALSEASIAPLDGEQRCGYNSNLLYIYTSGTTGLPKAAIIRHSRYLIIVSGTFKLVNLHCNDVIYDPLPLYHSAGGMIGIGQVLLFGCTAVIRKKFSVSTFWTEVVQHQCTVGCCPCHFRLG